MPWCSVVRDGKDGGTLGPFAKWAVASTPYCMRCPSSSISVPIPSCLRPHSQWVTSGDHANGIPVALAAGDDGCHLLGHPHSRDGHCQQVHAKTAALTTGCWGELLLSLCQHHGGLKCIQKAIGTLSRAQTMTFPLGS